MRVRTTARVEPRVQIAARRTTDSQSQVARDSVLRRGTHRRIRLRSRGCRWGRAQDTRRQFDSVHESRSVPLSSCARTRHAACADLCASNTKPPVHSRSNSHVPQCRSQSGDRGAPELWSAVTRAGATQRMPTRRPRRAVALRARRRAQLLYSPRGSGGLRESACFGVTPAGRKRPGGEPLFTAVGRKERVAAKRRGSQRQHIVLACGCRSQEEKLIQLFARVCSGGAGAHTIGESPKR